MVGNGASETPCSKEPLRFTFRPRDWGQSPRGWSSTDGTCLTPCSLPTPTAPDPAAASCALQEGSESASCKDLPVFIGSWSHLLFSMKTTDEEKLDQFHNQRVNPLLC